MLALSHGALCTVANGLRSMGRRGDAVIEGRLARQRCGCSAYLFHACGHRHLSICVLVAACGVSACMKGTEDMHWCPPPAFRLLPAVCLVP